MASLHTRGAARVVLRVSALHPELDTNLIGPLLDYQWSIRTTELSYLPGLR